MKKTSVARDFLLNPNDTERLGNLCGPLDSHLRQLETRLGVSIASRGNRFRVEGEHDQTVVTQRVLESLFDATKAEILSPQQVNLALSESNLENLSVKSLETDAITPQELTIKVKRGIVKGRGHNQQRYLHAIARHDINFGIGPAGTGKTYLAVASAVLALEESRVQRIILARPAVEAGEKLGFLPGDLSQKVDPYLRPLYDSLYEMLGVERVNKLLERNAIEIAPLAYMRGRTLNDAFVILDEAQNTTIEQMKMFLTRIGLGSIAVITGDITQIDLPRHTQSGLRHAMQVLHHVDGIAFTFFDAKDVVRHPLVQRIVTAYEAHEASIMPENR